MTTAAIDRSIDRATAAPGHGVVELTKVGARTIASRCAATSPLKLLQPRANRGCAWIIASTYGGGLVDGDSIRLDVTAGPGTRCVLGTQASTKVYRSPRHGCSQCLDISVGRDAIALVAPDPIVCYAGACFEQRQRFDLADGAGLVMIDWLSSGRWACGERWAFDGYRSDTLVAMNGKPIFRDVTLLNPADGPIAGEMRMGKFDCFATLLVVGEALQEHATRLLSFVSEQPAPAVGAPLLFAASPVEGGGVVVRIAGPGAEAVGRWMRQLVSFVIEIVGDDPWARKW